jgi:hypothetical protein
VIQNIAENTILLFLKAKKETVIFDISILDAPRTVARRQIHEGANHK